MSLAWLVGEARVAGDLWLCALWWFLKENQYNFIMLLSLVMR